MYFEAGCGMCESNFSLDTEDEDGAWLILMRWSEAHARCDWIANATGQPDKASEYKVVLGPEDQADPLDLISGTPTDTVE